PMHKGYFAGNQLGHCHIRMIGDLANDAENVVSLGMPPPGASNRLANNKCGNTWKFVVGKQDETRSLELSEGYLKCFRYCLVCNHSNNVLCSPFLSAFFPPFFLPSS